MSQFFGVFRHEFLMSIRRPSLIIAFGLLFSFYTLAVFWQSDSTQRITVSAEQIWRFSGRMGFTFNLFLPVLVGILSADRMQRDFRQGVRELQLSTPLKHVTYILGKYFGVLASVSLPVLIWVWMMTSWYILYGNAPLRLFSSMTLVYFTMMFPAFAFVLAFSLTFPLMMPIRVYQILFTGYWFWGNYIDAEVFPTLNGTLLTPGGMLVFQGYFGGFSASTPLEYTTTDATLNLIVLGLSVASVLVMTKYYLSWQSRRA
jgi:ABC-type transport system involved in multi-copper enzyme maturation permease subunit